MPWEVPLNLLSHHRTPHRSTSVWKLTALGLLVWNFSRIYLNQCFTSKAVQMQSSEVNNSVWKSKSIFYARVWTYSWFHRDRLSPGRRSCSSWSSVCHSRSLAWHGQQVPHSHERTCISLRTGKFQCPPSSCTSQSCTLFPVLNCQIESLRILDQEQSNTILEHQGWKSLCIGLEWSHFEPCPMPFLISFPMKLVLPWILCPSCHFHQFWRMGCHLWVKIHCSLYSKSWNWPI